MASLRSLARSLEPLRQRRSALRPLLHRCSQRRVADLLRTFPLDMRQRTAGGSEAGPEVSCGVASGHQKNNHAEALTKIAPALLLLPLMLGQAYAEESAWQRMDTKVTTEAGALAVVERIVSKMEAAIPALTPEDQHYVAQERAFADQLGKTSGRAYTSERVNAFESSQPFYEWVAHQQLDHLREDVNLIHALHSSNQRFAVWADVIISLSHVEPMQNALAGLHRLGVISPSDVGEPEAVSWLRGPSEGKVQILWPLLAETMWVGWGQAGLGRAVGLKSNP